MALAKVDYDAQAAEEAWTRLLKHIHDGPPPAIGESTGGLLSVLCFAAIAQAHALEAIVKKLDDVSLELESIHSKGIIVNYRVSPKE